MALPYRNTVLPNEGSSRSNHYGTQYMLGLERHSQPPWRPVERPLELPKGARTPMET